MICSWCILIYLKGNYFWRFVQFTQRCDDITTLLLVLLVCMENIFKELFLSPSQGVSLSIADAKVDTFYKLTKHSWKFFVSFFNKNYKSLIFKECNEKLFLAFMDGLTCIGCKTKEIAKDWTYISLSITYCILPSQYSPITSRLWHYRHHFFAPVRKDDRKYDKDWWSLWFI